MTDNPEQRISWLSYVPPLGVAALAVLALLLTPIYALDWYRQPFIGAFLEPNLVVTETSAEDWPALAAGVRHPDRLVAVRGQMVENVREVNAVLEENGMQPLILNFEKQGGERYTVIVRPRAVRPGEMVGMFLIPYATGLAFLLTGLWAFRFGYYRRPALAFLLFTAATCIAIVTLFDLRTTHHLSLAWVLSMPVAAGAMAHLGLVFPRRMPFVRRYPALRFLPWLAVAAVAVPSLREYLQPSSPWAYIRPWLNSYILGGLAILFLLVTLIMRATRDESAVVRQQSRIIVFGAAIAFGPILFLFFLPSSLGQGLEFRASILIPPMAIFPVSVAYAIVRYRLIDVDRLLSSGMTYAGTMGVASVLLYLLITLLSFVFEESLKANDPLVMSAFLLLMVLLLNPIRQQTENAINRLFYRDQADYRRVLSSLSRSLISTPDLKRTLEELEASLRQAINPDHVVLFLYDDDQGRYRPHTTGDVAPIDLVPENPLVKYLNRAKEAVWLAPDAPYPPELEGEADFLTQMNCQAFAPLTYEDRLVGILGLGGRRSGELYDSDDLDFLNAIASQSSLAIEVARLFSNLERTLGETLEMKNLMDDIFASMPSGVITTDLEEKITLFNQAAERILGVQVSRALGRRLNEALPYYWEGLQPLTIATLRQGSVVLGREYTPEIPGRDHLYLRLSSTPLRDANLKTIGATILIDDLTEKRELERERERIRQTFGRVVAPRVRDRLLNDPTSLQLDGKQQTITVLFADLYHFTSFSERIEARQLFAILNSYLSLAAQAVLAEEGTLDKFMGDAVMALWNAPDRQKDHTLRAVRAAIAIQNAIQAHRQAQPEDHHLFFKIGIGCGEAVVGNVGTSELFNYTAIGDTVNLVRRLESIAKPGQILISERAYPYVKDHVDAEELEAAAVKGKAKPVKVYEVKGLRQEQAAKDPTSSGGGKQK